MTFSPEGHVAVTALNILQIKPFKSVDMIRGYTSRLSRRVTGVSGPPWLAHVLQEAL